MLIFYSLIYNIELKSEINYFEELKLNREDSNHRFTEIRYFFRVGVKISICIFINVVLLQKANLMEGFNIPVLWLACNTRKNLLPLIHL